MCIRDRSNAAVKNNPNSNVKGWNISAPETTRAPGSAFTYNVYPVSYTHLDVYKRQGIYHKNTASRKISRLTVAVNKLA